MDLIDHRLLELLAEDARLPIKALAAKVQMSAPAVAERVRRLRERGVIRRFTIEIDPHAVGYAIEAIVRVRPFPGRVGALERVMRGLPEIVECDKVTGDDCFIVRLLVSSINDIEPIVDRIAKDATTITSIVKSKPVSRRMPRPRLGGD